MCTSNSIEVTWKNKQTITYVRNAIKPNHAWAYTSPTTITYATGFYIFFAYNETQINTPCVLKKKKASKQPTALSPSIRTCRDHTKYKNAKKVKKN